MQNQHIDLRNKALRSVCAGQPTQDLKDHKFTSKGQPWGSKEVLGNLEARLISCFIDQYWANIQEETALYLRDEIESLGFTVKMHMKRGCSFIFTSSYWMCTISQPLYRRYHYNEQEQLAL